MIRASRLLLATASGELSVYLRDEPALAVLDALASFVSGQ
jgi:hypothetical protein